MDFQFVISHITRGNDLIGGGERNMSERARLQQRRIGDASGKSRGRELIDFHVSDAQRRRERGSERERERERERDCLRNKLCIR